MAEWPSIVCLPHLHPSEAVSTLWQWKTTLQCVYDTGGAYIFEPVFLFSWDKFPKVELLVAISYGSSMPNFVRNLHTVSHRGCANLHSHQQGAGGSPFPPPRQHLLFLVFLITAILTGVRWQLLVVLICILWRLVRGERVFTYLLATWVSSWEKCLPRSTANFLIGCLFALQLSCLSSFYIWILIPDQIDDVQILSSPRRLLFRCVVDFLCCAEAFSWM